MKSINSKHIKNEIDSNKIWRMRLESIHKDKGP